jgi:selenocysteine lyase/cysteine desulfurase
MPAATETRSRPRIVGPHAYGAAFADELHGQINLDYAATTPALQAAVDAVLHVLPAYGSVHRGGGARSRLTTDAYEEARAAVGRFFDCDDERVVVFVRNTTEAINLVAASLPRRSRILCSPLEHHANLLPWRDHDIEYLPFVRSPDDLVAEAAAALGAAARAGRPFDVLAVCGASNVTGEIVPVAELVELAHEHGTQVLLDAAQLAPHRRVSARELDIDYLAVSGHKLYAPFGVGALILRRNELQAAPPLLKGGGAVRAVTLDDVAWADLPHRLEAGTPNVLGAIALAAACDELASYGLDTIAAEETRLAQQLWAGLERVPGARVLRAWDGGERVGVASFTLEGLEPRDVSARLADEYGIAVRSGLFCAHPLVAHLLRTSRQTSAALMERARAGEDVVLPGAVRASVGLGVEPEHVERLLDALDEL